MFPLCYNYSGVLLETKRINQKTDATPLMALTEIISFTWISHTPAKAAGSFVHPSTTPSGRDEPFGNARTSKFCATLAVYKWQPKRNP